MVTEMSNCKTISYSIYFHNWIDKYRTEQDNIFQINSNILFVCVEVLRPSQPNGVMSSAVSLPKHTFTGQG